MATKLGKIDSRDVVRETVERSAERWKWIRGYEGLYKVSTHGRVKSVARTARTYRGSRTVRARILRPGFRKGYPFVAVSKNSCVKVFTLHRLVLDTFVGSRPPGQECRHLDGNSRNCRLENLVWGTHSENGRDMSKHETVDGERNGSAKLDRAMVRAIIEAKHRGVPSKVLAQKFNVTRGLIWLVFTGKLWKSVRRK
jgi:hypothetical protein